MSNTPPTAEPDGSPLPRNPPLEIIEVDGEWVLETYQSGRRDGVTFSTHDSQIEAMRAGKTRMDEDIHPCLLRWDAPDIVGNIYWNPLFREVEVRYDEMMQRWVVVPEAGHFLFHTSGDRRQACEYGQTVKRKYDFRHLVVYTPDGHRQREVDHRFVRQSLGKSGVRFDRSKLRGSADTEDEDEDAGEDEVLPGTTPARALSAAVPDITQVQVLDAEGAIHRYRAAWTDERDARILALSADHSRANPAVNSFTDAVDRWKTVEHDDRVTTVLDSGIGPSPWVAYPAGDGSLADRLDDLDLRSRLDVVSAVAGALDVGTRHGVAPRGVTPETVRLRAAGGSWQATLSDWGLTRAVRATVFDPPVTPYTAPEQLDGTDAATTGVYQLGALAYRLLADTAPFADAPDLEAAIRNGDRSSVTQHSDVPSGVERVLSQAMALDPADRYSQATTFRVHLLEHFE